jgi:hypothetical protein
MADFDTRFDRLFAPDVIRKKMRKEMEEPADGLISINSLYFNKDETEEQYIKDWIKQVEDSNLQDIE